MNTVEPQQRVGGPVLVTGGCGFVGSHVVDAFVDAGVDVRVLDRDPPRWPNGRAEYRVGDITDLDAVQDAVDGVVAVSHQAATVGLGVNFSDAPRFARDNDLGTATLLAALHDADFHGRLVLASSMVVYGEGQYRCREHGDVRAGARPLELLARGEYEPLCGVCAQRLIPQPIMESTAIDPRNVYAATKLHQEHLFACFAREHPGATATALRYHNVYGPRMPEHTPYAGVAALFRAALARGEAPQLFEDGRQLRDFVHVRDVARANVLPFTRRTAIGGALNIASGTPRSIGDVAHSLWRSFPESPRPAIIGGYRAGDVRHIFGSPDVAQERLGFAAEVEFDVGIAELAGRASTCSDSHTKAGVG